MAAPKPSITPAVHRRVSESNGSQEDAWCLYSPARSTTVRCRRGSRRFEAPTRVADGRFGAALLTGRPRGGVRAAIGRPEDGASTAAVTGADVEGQIRPSRWPTGRSGAGREPYPGVRELDCGRPGRTHCPSCRRCRPSCARELDKALARPAAQQPEWPDPEQTKRVRARAGERAADHRAAPRSTGCKSRLADGRPRRGLPAPGRRLRGDVRATPSRTSAPTCARCCRWPSCSPTARACRWSRSARIAGQYAKPRSAATDALGLPVYRGDIINSLVAKPELRVPGSRAG